MSEHALGTSAARRGAVGKEGRPASELLAQMIPRAVDLARE
jgi:hypothetical protein